MDWKTQDTGCKFCNHMLINLKDIQTQQMLIVLLQLEIPEKFIYYRKLQSADLEMNQQVVSTGDQYFKSSLIREFRNPHNQPKMHHCACAVSAVSVVIYSQNVNLPLLESVIIDRTQCSKNNCWMSVPHFLIVADISFCTGLLILHRG